MLNKLEADNLSEEELIKGHETEIKIHRKRIAGNDEVIRALRARLGVTNPSKKSSRYGSKAEILRQAIKQINLTRFTRFDLEKEIKRANPEMEIDERWISSALWSLNKNKKLIKTVVHGSNQNAAEYEKLAASNVARRMVTNHHVNGPTHFNRSSVGVTGVGGGGTLTATQLEDFVREKNRRIDEITAHFGVDEATVVKLYQPASKVFAADRGWIKINE